MSPHTLPASLELAEIAARLDEDELRVLVRIAKRLQLGQGVYGRLHIAADTRGFRNEAREEIEDALVYFACAWLKGEGRDR